MLCSARWRSRSLTPEQLYDSLDAVLGQHRRQRRGHGSRASRQSRPGERRATQFVTFFQGDEGADCRPSTRPASRRPCG